jgi:hypothetical protein
MQFKAIYFLGINFDCCGRVKYTCLRGVDSRAILFLEAERLVNEISQVCQPIRHRCVAGLKVLREKTNDVFVIEVEFIVNFLLNKPPWHGQRYPVSANDQPTMSAN